MSALTNPNNIFLVVIFSLYFTSTLYIFHIINKLQPTPFIDEIFHIPQAQKYCDHNFTHWDEKITTPPGLYLISTGILKPFHWLSGGDYFACTTTSLRAINLLFAFGNFYLAYAISSLLQPQRVARKQVVLTALAVAMFPPAYFFTNLYYTDQGALFFVLLMYMFHLHGRYTMAACFGGLAVLFRQTSIIWVFFVAATKSLAIAQDTIRFEGSRKKMMPLQLISVLYAQKKQFPVVLSEVLSEMGVYLFLGLIFAAGVVFNQGLVLGDRDAHSLVLNLPQLGYFLVFCLFFASSHLLTMALATKFVRFMAEVPVLIGAILCCCALAVKHFSLVHPYLLSDNRHLAFYIWRRIIARNAFTPYLLIPVYIYAGWAILHRLSNKSSLWKLVLCICIALSTVPQRLLEFRYFVIPYIILRLNFPSFTYLQLFMELIVYAITNIVTLLIFANYTFTWPDEQSLQRIIW